MATRFYLGTSSAAPTAPAVRSDWERSIAAFARHLLGRTKTNSALADVSALMGSTATSQTCWHQWVSEPLVGDQTISGTISMVVRCLEGGATEDAHLAFIFRVMQGDSTTLERGTPTIFHATSTEFATGTAATRIHSARALTASISALSGDRIVIEIGVHAVTANNTANLTLRFGDPSATADFALTADLTTDLCPWVEFSTDLVFDAPTNASVTAVAATETTTGAAPTVLGIQQGAVTAVAAISTVTAVAPTVVAVQSATVSAVAATVTCTAAAPTVVGMQQAEITAVAASQTVTAAVPTVSGGGGAESASVEAVAATIAAVAAVPAVVAVQQVAVEAPSAVVDWAAVVPIVLAVENGVVLAAAAVQQWSAVAPLVVVVPAGVPGTTGGGVTGRGSVGHGGAQPGAAAAHSHRATVAAGDTARGRVTAGSH